MCNLNPKWSAGTPHIYEDGAQILQSWRFGRRDNVEIARGVLVEPGAAFFGHGEGFALFEGAEDGQQVVADEAVETTKDAAASFSGTWLQAASQTIVFNVSLTGARRALKRNHCLAWRITSSVRRLLTRKQNSRI